MKPEWKDLRRKPSVEDLRNRLGRLYKIQREHEGLMRTMLELTQEKVENTMHDRNRQEERDLETCLELAEKQREALLGQYRLELKRFYRFLEKVKNPKVKLILVLRHVHFLSWNEIAGCIGTDVKKVKYLHEEFVLER